MDEELTGRQMPHALDAEQAVLGSILIDNSCVAEVIGILRPDDFYLEQNREIYETIYTMFNFSQTIDPVTVLDKMRELGCFHENSLRPDDFYLEQNREIYETIYTMFNFSQTIDPVTVLDKMRELGCFHENSRDYILQLMEITPTAARVERYARIVLEKAILRGLAKAASDIRQIVYDQVGTPGEI